MLTCLTNFSLFMKTIIIMLWGCFKTMKTLVFLFKFYLQREFQPADSLSNSPKARMAEPCLNEARSLEYNSGLQHKGKNQITQTSTIFSKELFLYIWKTNLQREGQRDLPSVGSLPKWLQLPVMSQSTGSQELQACLPHGWSGPRLEPFSVAFPDH